MISQCVKTLYAKYWLEIFAVRSHYLKVFLSLPLCTVGSFSYSKLSSFLLTSWGLWVIFRTSSLCFVVINVSFFLVDVSLNRLSLILLLNVSGWFSLSAPIYRPLSCGFSSALIADIAGSLFCGAFLFRFSFFFVSTEMALFILLGCMSVFLLLYSLWCVSFLQLPVWNLFRVLCCKNLVRFEWFCRLFPPPVCCCPGYCKF